MCIILLKKCFGVNHFNVQNITCSRLKTDRSSIENNYLSFVWLKSADCILFGNQLWWAPSD